MLTILLIVVRDIRDIINVVLMQNCFRLRLYENFV